jgi:acylphosphatase
MKLKIIIAGPKVHDVGYRYFLMSTAMDLGLCGFHARNQTRGNEREVIALVEGDEEAVANFKSLAETNRPVGAEVSSVGFEEYHGTVMPAGQYVQVCSALQLNKAIPILLEIRDSSKAMLEKQDKTLDAIKDMHSDLGSKQDKTIEEIKGLREDVRSGVTVQIQHVQSDVRAIKDRLGMP